MFFWILFIATVYLFAPFPLFLFFLQKKLHRHVPARSKLPSNLGLKYQDVEFLTADGMLLHAWWIPANQSKATIVLIPGLLPKIGGKSAFLPVAQFLQKAGYSVFLVDLRSQGQSPGNKIYLGTKEWQDVLAAVNIAAQKTPGNRKIGIMGFSMGAASTLVAAAQLKTIDFVIAGVPFARYRSLFSSYTRDWPYPRFWLDWLLKLSATFLLKSGYEQWDPIKHSAHITVPALIFGATHDKSVYYNDSLQISQSIKGKSTHIALSTGHAIYKESPEEFAEHTLQFLDHVC